MTVYNTTDQWALHRTCVLYLAETIGQLQPYAPDHAESILLPLIGALSFGTTTVMHAGIARATLLLSPLDMKQQVIGSTFITFFARLAEFELTPRDLASLPPASDELLIILEAFESERLRRTVELGKGQLHSLIDSVARRSAPPIQPTSHTSARRAANNRSSKRRRRH